MSLRDLWDELSVPAGREQTPAGRLGTGVAHAALGAAAGAGLGALGAGHLAGTAIVGVVYLVGKEVGDMRRGGDWRDGLIDTAFVVLGAATAGAMWAPAAWLVAGVADGAWGRSLRGGR